MPNHIVDSGIYSGVERFDFYLLSAIKWYISLVQILS